MGGEPGDHRNAEPVHVIRELVCRSGPLARLRTRTCRRQQRRVCPRQQPGVCSDGPLFKHGQSVPPPGELVRLQQATLGLLGELLDGFVYRGANNRCHVLAGEQSHGLQGSVVVVCQPQ
jgi:hypothetical protein